MDPIEGPYEFGDQPPRELMGWLPEQVAEAQVKCARYFVDFRMLDTPRPQPPPPIWTLTKRINKGDHLPTFRQKIGDCIGAGIRQTGARLQVADIAARFQEEVLRPWFVPFIYGISRVQIGRGQIDGDGSTGAWGAAAVKQYGVLFDDDTDVPLYSADVGRTWGRPPGPPETHIRTAASRPVKSTARLTTIHQIRTALCNYHPITIASMRGFKMQPVNRDGFHVFVPEGTWPHQMALLAWMDEPFQAAYRLNSWGPNPHGTPLNDEPPGGAWCTADCIEEELQARETEVFTYSGFAGFPTAPNRGLIR